MAVASSLFVTGFMTKALMPMAFALPASTRWEKPVHMMMGMSALMVRIDLFDKFLACYPRHGLVGNDKIEP